MSNSNFTFGPHVTRVEYPDTPVLVMGRGFFSAVKPFRVPPNNYILTFQEGAMRYQYVAGLINPTKNTDRNIMALEAFYAAHGMWDSFLYPHPVLGSVRCRFAEPYRSPQVSDGVCKEFSLKLTAQPT